jgi:deoxyribonuclease V
MVFPGSQISHSWVVTPKEAVAIQQELREKIIRVDQIPTIRRIAGIDVGFEDDKRISRAGVVVLDFPSLEVRERVIARVPTSFPYVPGLLSFREVPVILEALGQLDLHPDLIFCDGQGLAHPRRLGLACHLGLATGMPSIGVAKSRLIGEYEMPGNERGDWERLLESGEVIGAVVRTRPNVKPVFVSIGHRISLETAIELTMQCTGNYRIPEPTRLAHQIASRGN